MVWEIQFAALIPYILAILFATGVGIQGLRYLPERGRLAMAINLFSLAIWVGVILMEVISATDTHKVFWMQLHVVIIGVVSATWLAYIKIFTSDRKPSRFFYLILIGSVILTILFIFTNGSHHLMFTRVILSEETRFTSPVMEFGSGMLAFGIYAFGMVTGAIILLIQKLIHANQNYRNQIIGMLTVTMVPSIAIVIHLLRWNPYPLFSTIPFGVLLTTMIHALNIYYYQRGARVTATHEAIITGLSDGLVILDAANSILDLNPAARIILGLEHREVIGEPIGEFWSDWQKLYTGFQTGLEKNFEISFGSGFQKRTFDIRISNSFDNSGAFACRIVVLSDISDLKLAQSALQKAHDELEARVVARTADLALAESRYRSVMEQSVDVIFLVDLETLRILEANSAFQELLGYPAEDIPVLDLQDFIAHGPEELDPIINRVREEKQVLMVEARFRHRDGTTIDVEVAAGLISYGDRQVISVVARDIRTRKQAEKDLESYAQKQAIVAELGQQALAGEDFTAFLGTILKEVSESLQADLVGVFELLPTTSEMKLLAGLGWKPALVDSTPLPLDDSKHELRYTLDSQDPVYIEDLTSEDRCRPSQILLDHGVRTSLNIAIRGQERPYGVLGVHTCTERSYSTDDINFLQTVANLLASTMAFEQGKAAIKARNREILALQTAGTAITSSLDLEDVLHTVARETARWLGVAGCAISEWHQDRDVIQTMMDFGPEDWSTEDLNVGQEVGLEFDLADYPLSKHVLTDRIPRQLNLGDPNIDPAEKAFMEADEITTLLMLPMIFQGRVIGLVEAMDDWSERTFTDQEIAMGQLLANQAASAIENARLFEEIQQRLSEQTALREAAEAISSALDQKEVLSQIVEQMTLNIDATSAYVCIVDNETKISTVLAEYIGEEACEAETASDLGVSFEEYDPEFLNLMEADSVSITNVNDPELSDREHEEMLQFGAKSILYVPLIYQNNLLGFVEIWESRRLREFTPEEITFCQGLARHAAIAINNANLFKETQQRLAEQTALREAVTAISSALDLEAVLGQIVEQMALTIDATSAYICIVDPRTRRSTVLSEFIGEEASEAERSSDIGETYEENEPGFYAIMEAGEVDTSQVDDPDLDEIERNHMVTHGAKSILYIPFNYQGNLLGFAEIWESRRVREFERQEIALGQDLARHAAIAINNARLYQQAQVEIRERQLAEQGLENYARELERSNAELEQFAYVASHDLQEPLRMVTSYVQLLDRRYGDELDEDAGEFIGYAVEGATRMQRLIHDLLNYSRIGAQREPFAETDCEPVVHAALKNLQAAIEESRANITCDSLPTIRADSGQLIQLFQNLIGNAIKFRCEDPPKIHIGAARTNGVWKFSVQDNGIGMDPQHKDKIFLIFQRLHSPETYPGTGVGLAICKRIVEQHNGQIWAESAVGQGSTFYFTIDTGEHL